jgi:hypothetical protein
MMSLLAASDPCEHDPSRALAPVEALAATNLDLLLDPAGLDLDLWQWSGGPYAAEVEGPNGKRGVRLLNFAGWISLIAGVTLAYRGLGPGTDPARSVRPGLAGGPRSGRGAALLLLSYYLPAAAWATKRCRFRYLLYSAPFAAALWAALKDRS